MKYIIVLLISTCSITVKADAQLITFNPFGVHFRGSQKVWWYNSNTCDSVFSKTKPSGSGWSKTPLTFVTYYQDADADGFGNILVSSVSCHTLDGYVTNSTDCNDANNQVWRLATVFIDLDHDGWTNGTAIICYGAALPSGYSFTSNGSDCNDLDAMVHSPNTYYIDNDGDTYGSTNTAQLCVSIAPPKYSTNNTDCDDNNALIHSPITYFPDNDKDGSGGKIGVAFCQLNPPVGYVTNNCDPDDNNPYLTCNNIPNPNLQTLSITLTDTIIQPIYCASYSNLEKQSQVQGNPQLTSWLCKDTLGVTSLAWVIGAELKYDHPYSTTTAPNKGFNCVRAEAQYQSNPTAPRPYCDTTMVVPPNRVDKFYSGVIDNRCCTSGSFNYWTDFLFTIDTMGSSFIFAPNIEFAFYDSATTRHYTHALSDYTKQITDINARKIPIVFTQWNVESQFDTYLWTAQGKLTTPVGQQYKKTCNDLQAWMLRNTGGGIYSADLAPTNPQNFNSYSTTVTGISTVRYYQDCDSLDTTYDGCRYIMSTKFEDDIKAHQLKYSSLKMAYVQTEFKRSNPFSGTVGEALCTIEAYMSVRKDNLKYNNIINQLSEMNLAHLFGKKQGSLFRQPIYFTFRFNKDFDNSDHCTTSLPLSFTDVKSDGCQTSDGTVEVIVLNQSDKTQTIQQITINGGVFSPYRIEGYYGNITDKGFTIDNSLILEPHSAKKMWINLTIPTNSEY